MAIPKKPKKAQPAQNENGPTYMKATLNPREFSAYSGYSLGYTYQLTSARLIPHYKPRNGRIFFKREEIDQFLQSRAVPTNADLEQAATNYTTTKKGNEL